MKEFVYRCTECEKTVVIPADEEPPECHGKMVRDYSGVGIIFKGYEFVGETYHEKRDR